MRESEREGTPHDNVFHLLLYSSIRRNGEIHENIEWIEMMRAYTAFAPHTYACIVGYSMQTHEFLPGHRVKSNAFSSASGRIGGESLADRIKYTKIETIW